MTKTTTGWIIFLASVGMMFGLLSVDIVALHDFGELYTPLFVGTFMGHVAAVITAFVGGKLIPAERDGNLRTRLTDVPRSEPDK